MNFRRNPCKLSVFLGAKNEIQHVKIYLIDEIAYAYLWKIKFNFIIQTKLYKMHGTYIKIKFHYWWQWKWTQRQLCTKMGRKTKQKNQIMISSIYILTSLYVKERACWTSESRKRQGSVEQNLKTNDPNYHSTFQMFLPNTFPYQLLILWFSSLCHHHNSISNPSVDRNKYLRVLATSDVVVHYYSKSRFPLAYGRSLTASLTTKKYQYI